MYPAMKNNFKLDNGTLFLKGTITVNTAGDLLAEIKKIFINHADLDKIDCSHIEVVDSAVISLLLSCMREAKKINRDINIIGMGNKISELATLYEVENIIHG